jgi:hypothetical protein
MEMVALLITGEAVRSTMKLLLKAPALTGLGDGTTPGGVAGALEHPNWKTKLNKNRTSEQRERRFERTKLVSPFPD